ncbi:hypothetical protein GGH91_004117 [Coemansia sp. RSA 2671]|uniref:Uncharacterized protein n=1 Tax=Coemansia linderi TaxID=2663919 RepID=A0ACC1KCS3_9FUNG|nr:hypothetical protein LPJ60_002548 [Coemansia sp. RSA 2675]KAJ2340596.1 hypothetical protein GGH91_004117 [Coemansia sp. RSA 2671]KAJ2702309.1 hypothetical protein H4218_000954 [Coemansia sp. IMI 209128]KAJ2786676.1 hypothetical protein GGI18_003234 [Coemansia linderi]
MPELPDVERARKLLQACCVGKKISNVTAADDSIVFTNERGRELETLLAGRKLLDVGRRGKQFWLTLSGGLCLLMHFGMTGEIHVQGEKQNHYRKIDVDVGTEWPPRFTKFEMELTGKVRVAFTDPRRLGRIRTFAGDAADCPTISKLGFDPVLDPPELGVFQEAVSRRRMPIKSLLLSQDFSAGVGNWIADEVLYQSRIHPQQLASTLSEPQTAVLLQQLKDICNKAVEVNAESKLFPEDWLFHYRWSKGKGRKPAMPNGLRIEFVTVGGRTSAFVPDLQPAPSATRKRKAKSDDD